MSKINRIEKQAKNTISRHEVKDEEPVLLIQKYEDEIIKNKPM